MNDKEQTENHLLNYILVFFVCALIGWLWEVLLTFIKIGAVVNRGVLHGPWLPIYGFGGLGMAILLRPLRKHPWAVFLAAAIGCGALEYFTGWYLETFKHLRWWNYSKDFLNLNGRICLVSVLTFGLCGLFMVYFLYPKLVKLFDHLKLRPKKVLCFALVLFFVGDFVYSWDVPNTGRGITSELSVAQVESAQFSSLQRNLFVIK